MVSSTTRLSELKVMMELLMADVLCLALSRIGGAHNHNQSKKISEESSAAMAF